MFKNDQILQNHVDFDNAMFLGTSISVWRRDQYIDYGGKIKNHDNDAVFIDGGYFLKKEFEFKVRSCPS